MVMYGNTPMSNRWALARWNAQYTANTHSRVLDHSSSGAPTTCSTMTSTGAASVTQCTSNSADSGDHVRSSIHWRSDSPRSQSTSTLTSPAKIRITSTWNRSTHTCHTATSRGPPLRPR